MKKYILINFVIVCTILLVSISTCFAGECNPDTETCLKNPLGNTINDKEGNPSINVLVGQLINGVLGLVGSLALAMFIYGGMLAAGDSGKVQKGKDILIWATIGIVVIFSAYAVVKFVLEGVLGT